MSEVYREPETSDEWQDVVDFAHTSLCIDSARAYGLITGGPQVNQERCDELIRRGADMGINPRPDAFERCVPLLLSGKVS